MLCKLYWDKSLHNTEAFLSIIFSTFNSLLNIDKHCINANFHFGGGGGGVVTGLGLQHKVDTCPVIQ